MSTKLNIVINTLREEKELTQQQLADKAGLTRGYISRLEAGDYTDTDGPAIKTLIKIAEGLSVPIELILNRAGITKEDYIKNNHNFRLAMRAKYSLSEEEAKKVEQYINKLKDK